MERDSEWEGVREGDSDRKGERGRELKGAWMFVHQLQDRTRVREFLERDRDRERWERGGIEREIERERESWGKKRERERRTGSRDLSEYCLINIHGGTWGRVSIIRFLYFQSWLPLISTFYFDACTVCGLMNVIMQSLMSFNHSVQPC